MDEFQVARKTEEEMKETVREMQEEENRFRDDALHILKNMETARDHAASLDQAA